MSSWITRKKISEDTLARIPAILHEVREGSSDSWFISEQLSPLPQDKCPTHPPTTVRVINSDSFTAARDIIREAAAKGETARKKTAVLNLASDLEPAGGWAQTLSRTQVGRESYFVMRKILRHYFGAFTIHLWWLRRRKPCAIRPHCTQL